MKLPSVSHLDDGALARGLRSAVDRERIATAEVLVHIAEFDSRRLYAPAGYPSMRAYCMEELGYSEDAAAKRIHAARTAREFPAIIEALAQGRLHLAGVCLLSAYLRPENADALLEAASHQSKAEIECLLAERFPHSETLPLVQTVQTNEATARGPANVTLTSKEHAPGHVASPSTRPKAEPFAPQRYSMPLAFGTIVHDKLQYLQDLLGHSLSTEEIEGVFERGLDERIEEIAKRKFAATEKPRKSVRRSEGPDYIPAPVRRTVRARDGGRCTFVSESGHRCGTRRHLQFDHIITRARGGKPTVENTRLCCWAHNQLEADRVFGTAFMDGKRAAGRQATAERAAARAQYAPGHVAMSAIPADPHAPAPIEIDPAQLMQRDLMAALRRLGYRADEARERVSWCASMPPEATLEDRVRAALRGPRYAPMQGVGAIGQSL